MNNTGNIKEKNNMSRFRLKRDMLNVSSSNDMKFRGPLSYRYIKVIAWLCIIVIQISNVIRLNFSLVKHQSPPAILELFNMIGSLGVPLLLISSFALLLNNINNIKKSILTYIGMSFAFAAGYFFVIWRYMIRLITLDGSSKRSAAKKLEEAMNDSGTASINMFIDMLLFSLIIFFMIYDPQKHFQGKRIYIFRLFTLIPFAYTIFVMVIEILVSNGVFAVPLWAIPFLNTKPPLVYVVFIFTSLFLKKREQRFIAAGKTREEYEAFLETNYNSFQVSTCLSAMIMLVGIIDFVASFTIRKMLVHYKVMSSSAAEKAVSNWGFGNVTNLISIVPIIMLFSYTKSHKNKMVDIMIPLAAVIAIMYVYFDGGVNMLIGYVNARSRSAA